MVQNMQLAASEVDSVLVQLLSTWAERGRDGSPRSQVCCTNHLCYQKEPVSPKERLCCLLCVRSSSSHKKVMTYPCCAICCSTINLGQCNAAFSTILHLSRSMRTVLTRHNILSCSPCCIQLAQSEADSLWPFCAYCPLPTASMLQYSLESLTDTSL